MKLFGFQFRKKQSSPSRVTAIDKNWVDENFEWMVKTLGLPKGDQIRFTVDDFPKALGSDKLSVKNLISDCCSHLDLDPELFSYEVHSDIRDIPSMPYSLGEFPSDCFLHHDEEAGNFKIILSRSILKHAAWLVASVCLSMCEAKLIQSRIQYDNGEDTDLFLYLAATFFGFGIIIAENHTDVGTKNDGSWQTRWAYFAKVPLPVMCHALVAFAKLRQAVQPSWLEALPTELKEMYQANARLVIDPEEGLSDQVDPESITGLQDLIDEQFERRDYAGAILATEKLLSLQPSTPIRASLYNGLGYCRIMLGDFEGSIRAFKKSIQLDPNFAYPHDNMSMALIMCGDLELAKHHLDTAVSMDDNVPAYSDRNRALYFQKLGDADSAEFYFKKALEADYPVDLLEYHYGLFLLEQGDRQKALQYIQISAQRGELQGANLLKSLASP